MSWLPAIGDAVLTLQGPGEVIGISEERDGIIWIWGGKAYEFGPYIVQLERGGEILGFRYDDLKTVLHDA